jgi:hypothetical protein
MSDTAFKNVTALKGIPVDEFMGTMGLFSAALGMCCLECHNEDWKFDTPRKKRARAMILMTDAINKTNFNGRKGRDLLDLSPARATGPYTTPPLDVIYGEPIFYQPDDLFQQAQGAPKPDEVLDKYIQAVGGAQRVAALTEPGWQGDRQRLRRIAAEPGRVLREGPQPAHDVHSHRRRRQDDDLRWDEAAGWRRTSRRYRS